jgi:WD40 repeat protein
MLSLNSFLLKNLKRESSLKKLLPLFCFLVLLHQNASAQLPRIFDAVDWSPDGSQIAIGGGSSGCAERPDLDYAVSILNAETLAIEAQFLGHTCRITSLEWSPDSMRIASSSIDGSGRVWDLATGELLASTQTPTLGRGEIAWSPDGTKLANVWVEDFRFEVWDAETGELLQLLANPDGKHPLFSLDWSPDGSHLATSSSEDENVIRVWDTANWEVSYITSAHPDVVTSVAWSPDGSKIASASYDGIIQIWDAVTGESLTSITANSTWHVAWDSSSTFIAAAMLENGIGIWNVETGEEMTVDSSSIGFVRDVAWHPHESRLIVIGSDGAMSEANLQIFSLPINETEE